MYKVYKKTTLIFLYLLIPLFGKREEVLPFVLPVETFQTDEHRRVFEL